MTSPLIEVHFKQARGLFYNNPQELSLMPREMVVVTFDSSEEIGTVVRNDIPSDRAVKRAGDILRKANDEDLARHQSHLKREHDAYLACQDLVAKHNLQMNLVDVEARFDGSKLVFFFTAEKRVDFRALVRDLAAMFKGRIEMRQIGVRDEARRVGGYGQCGRQLCCVSWLNSFEPVTLKMAKEQNLSMTSNKMLGLCGRLMCCLMYEDQFYEESFGQLPRVGSAVETPKGRGTVYKVDIFRQRVYVKFQEGHADFGLSEIKET